MGPCGRVEMFACVALAHGDHVGVHQAVGKVLVDITCSTSGLGKVFPRSLRRRGRGLLVRGLLYSENTARARA